MRFSLLAILVLLSQTFFQATALAVPADLIANGGFENNGGLGQLGTVSSASDWSVQVLTDPIGQGFAFIMDNTADSTGSPSIFSPPNVSIWGPNNGVNNGFTISPEGGDFLALNGSFSRTSISQTINGLTIGAQYELSFYWAIAQGEGFSGDFQGGWDLTFGSESASSGAQNMPSHGFSGWQTYTGTFTATSISQTFAFEATGTVGLDSYTLFDGITLNAVPVPEPSTYVMGTMATLLLGWISRKKRKGMNTDRTA